MQFGIGDQVIKVVISLYKDQNVQPFFQMQGNAFESLLWEAEDDKKLLKDGDRKIKSITYTPIAPASVEVKVEKKEEKV